MWDQEMHGPCEVLIRDQLLAAMALAEWTTLTQSHHTRSPAVERQMGLGRWREHVSSLCALTPGWGHGCFCFARARRLPSRRSLPPTLPADASLLPAPRTPPCGLNHSQELSEGRH